MRLRGPQGCHKKLMVSPPAEIGGKGAGPYARSANSSGMSSTLQLNDSATALAWASRI